MICIWWFLIPTLATLAEAGGASESGEAAANGAANAATMVNGMNAAVLNGFIINGQIVPIGPPLMVQPGGQLAIPMMPTAGLQQGLPFPVAQPPLALPQGQSANGGPQYFAIVPQGNGVGALQIQSLTPGQQIQIVPVGGAGGQNIMPPATGTQPAGNVRVKHSAPTEPSPSIPEETLMAPGSSTQGNSLANLLKFTLLSYKEEPEEEDCSKEASAASPSETSMGTMEDSSGTEGFVGN